MRGGGNIAWKENFLSEPPPALLKDAGTLMVVEEDNDQFIELYFFDELFC